jgi:hypothetical protein
MSTVTKVSPTRRPFEELATIADAHLRRLGSINIEMQEFEIRNDRPTIEGTCPAIRRVAVRI